MSLPQIFVFLAAAVVAVPLAKKWGMGSVLGYLLAGVIIGPSVMGWVGVGEDVFHIAEYGVVMMLFLIGLELRPSLLWRLRVPILGMGGTQVLTVATAIAFVGMLCRLEMKTSIAVGLILAMSSTAIVLQTLAERGQLKLQAGQSCFSVLLFQDIAVIPILAILPLLGSATSDVGDSTGSISRLSPSLRAIAVVGAVMAVVVTGRFALRPIFRFVAASGLREIFTGLTLLLVVGITLLMSAVGLSAALGAFVAGVVLADSEYRHQLEADLEPFKGLLLGLFFIAVGATIDFSLVRSQPVQIASCVLGLIGIKLVIQLLLGRAFRLDGISSLLFGVALAQGGEFCFVLLNVAQSSGVLTPEVAKLLVATVALSMALTPLLFWVHDRWLLPLVFAKKTLAPEREPEVVPENDHPVILAGFGRFGHIVGRLLMSNGIGCTVLENDPDQIDLLSRFGLKAYYGDATRLDLLHAAGAARAKLFICTLADSEKTLAVVKQVRHEFPQLRILARAHSRQHAYELIRAGVQDVWLEQMGSALDLGVEALRACGFRGVQAHRAAHLFKEHDSAVVRDMAGQKDEGLEYARRIRQHMRNLESLLANDRRRGKVDLDEGWVDRRGR